MGAKFGIIWIIYLNDPPFRPIVIISSSISIMSLCQRQSTTWIKAGNQIKQEIKRKKIKYLHPPPQPRVGRFYCRICHRDAPPPPISAFTPVQLQQQVSALSSTISLPLIQPDRLYRASLPGVHVSARWRLSAVVKPLQTHSDCSPETDVVFLHGNSGKILRTGRELNVGFVHASRPTSPEPDEDSVSACLRGWNKCAER